MGENSKSDPDLSEKNRKKRKVRRSERSKKKRRHETSGRSEKSKRSSKRVPSRRTRSSKSSKSSKSRSSKRRSKRPNGSERSKRRNTIKLIYKKGHRYVKIADFVAVSQLIKQHQVTGRVPRSIDLTDYFDSTITIFADYIEKGEVKAQISFYALAELLKLTKTFVMEDLQKRLEEILILTAETSTDHLIQAVLVAGTSNITKETENALHYLAAWSFVEMAKLPDFQRIPYHQFVILLASCELHVSHELAAADAALLWLVGQPHPAVYVPGVFSVIRSAYLTKVDRQLIIERIATLQMPESVARFARICMESRHSLRICLEGSHINRHLCRCGIPDPETRPKETALSLSRPREGIKWSEKNAEEQKKAKKSRMSKSRSKKRGKDRSRRRSRTSRKSELSKRRSSKSKRSKSDEDDHERTCRRRRKSCEDESRRKRCRSTSGRSSKRLNSKDSGKSSRRKRSGSERGGGGRSRRSKKENDNFGGGRSGKKRELKQKKRSA